MINKLGFTAPQHQQRSQKPAFKGEPEVKMLVDLTKDLTKVSTGNMSTLNSRINCIKKKVSQEDIKNAVKKVQDWQAKVFKLHIKD